jgi:hypothetical protein
MTGQGAAPRRKVVEDSSAPSKSRPSTQFFPAFQPGHIRQPEISKLTYRVADAHNVYVRYNQFNGDPVTGPNIRVFNLGYFFPVGRRSRLSFDYQFKNHLSFEDAAVNGRFQGVLLK